MWKHPKADRRNAKEPINCGEKSYEAMVVSLSLIYEDNRYRSTISLEGSLAAPSGVGRVTAYYSKFHTDPFF